MVSSHYLYQYQQKPIIVVAEIGIHKTSRLCRTGLVIAREEFDESLDEDEDLSLKPELEFGFRQGITLQLLRKYDRLLVHGGWGYQGKNGAAAKAELPDLMVIIQRYTSLGFQNYA